MPNWCSTEIEIYHDDIKALNALHKKIKEWTSKNYMENGFGHNWLGNIVLGSEIGTVDQGKETDIKCRGTLEYCEVFDNCIRISTETAWVPMLQMWLRIIDKYLPGGQLFYETIESGCGVCCTNKSEFIGMYFLICDDGVDYKYTTIAKLQLISFLQNKCKTNIMNIDILRDMCKKNCEFIDVYEWEYMPAEEWK